MSELSAEQKDQIRRFAIKNFFRSSRSNVYIDPITHQLKEHGIKNKINQYIIKKHIVEPLKNLYLESNNFLKRNPAISPLSLGGLFFYFLNGYLSEQNEADTLKYKIQKSFEKSPVEKGSLIKSIDQYWKGQEVHFPKTSNFNGPGTQLYDRLNLDYINKHSESQRIGLYPFNIVSDINDLNGFIHDLAFMDMTASSLAVNNIYYLINSMNLQSHLKSLNNKYPSLINKENIEHILKNAKYDRIANQAGIALRTAYDISGINIKPLQVLAGFLSENPYILIKGLYSPIKHLPEAFSKIIGTNKGFNIAHEKLLNTVDKYLIYLNNNGEFNEFGHFILNKAKSNSTEKLTSYNEFINSYNEYAKIINSHEPFLVPITTTDPRVSQLFPDDNRAKADDPIFFNTILINFEDSNIEKITKDILEIYEQELPKNITIDNKPINMTINPYPTPEIVEIPDIEQSKEIVEVPFKLPSDYKTIYQSEQESVQADYEFREEITHILEGTQRTPYTSPPQSTGFEIEYI